MSSVSHDTKDQRPPLGRKMARSVSPQMVRLKVLEYVEKLGWSIVVLKHLDNKPDFGVRTYVTPSDDMPYTLNKYWPLPRNGTVAPGRNIAVHLGKSKLLVIDFDIHTRDADGEGHYGKPFRPEVQAVFDKHAIKATNAPELLQVLSTLTPTPRIHGTRSEGVHVFFALDVDYIPMPKTASGDLGGGIDVLYGEKMAVLPPSVVWSDKDQAHDPFWGVYCEKNTNTPPPPPSWLLEAIRVAVKTRQKKAKKTPQKEGATPTKWQGDDPTDWVKNAIDQVKQGAGRNDTGTSLCGKLASLRYDPQTIEKYMRLYMTAVETLGGGSPYTEDEMLNTIASISGYIDATPTIGTETPQERPQEQIGVFIPPLPDYAIVDPIQGLQGCPWLDDYTAYSKTWSPRGWETFHTAVGLWVLSTVAARRVGFTLGDKTQYTSLYILLTSPSSIYAKTTTARIGLNLLDTAGLGFLKLPDEMTPQSMIQSQSEGHKTINAASHQATKDRIGNTVAFAGQRSWFYEEFGNALSKIMQENSNHHIYHGVLRQFDDHYPTYTSATLARGENTIYKPYMALLGNLTPADLTRHATKNHRFWSDGFWARFLFSSPPPGQLSPYIQPTTEQSSTPRHLVLMLQNWHQRLGQPDIKITYDRGDDEGKQGKQGKQGKDNITYSKDPTAHPETLLQIAPETLAAYSAYDRAMNEILQRLGEDMAGNYTRYSAKALRIATMFASLANAETVMIEHWVKAQTIVEQFRADLHYLYATVTEKREDTTKRIQEDRVLSYIRQHSTIGVTARDIYRALRLDTETTLRQIEALKNAGLVVARRVGGEKADRHYILE